MDKSKRNSLIFIAALIAAAALILFIRSAVSKRAAFVIVTSDGKEILRESLDNIEERITVTSEYGYNILEKVHTDDGKTGIHCIEADCPQHICIKTGIITEENDTIVCLPHKMTVRLIK